MLRLKFFIFLFFSLIVISCVQNKIKIPDDAVMKFEVFKQKEKFTEDMSIFYPGIGNPKLKPILTEKINQIADDFKKISMKKNVTEEDYQQAIKIGFDRFSNIYNEIDTEDRERICSYIEELMDIVKLKNSDGQLNNFMYNFNPSK